MRLFLLLALPWAVFSPWFGVAAYVFGLGVEALIVSSLPILIAVTVNIRTIVRISPEDVRYRPEQPRSSHPALQAKSGREFLELLSANRNHRPR